MPSTFTGVGPRDPADLTAPIVALASAAGSGARAIVRLSGVDVWAIARRCVEDPASLPETIARGRFHPSLRLPERHSLLPAQLLAWPAPRTYTGQDLVEFHILSSPALVDLLLNHLHACGARLARPGEFTLRAFLAGKLDLTQAEAVRGVIDAASSEGLKLALTQLAGGISQPLCELRRVLLDLLADVEAGLDFAEEDLTLLGRDRLTQSLAAAIRELETLWAQLGTRGVSGRAFRVVLAGLPNAGKSSLFNALAGRRAALVSPAPGTTRDYLIERLMLDGLEIELVDTAGKEAVDAADRIGGQAQAGQVEQLANADLILHCEDASNVAAAESPVPDDRPALRVLTKVDLLAGRVPTGANPVTSAVTGEGLEALRQLIGAKARIAVRPSALALSGARARTHIGACLEHLRDAARMVEQAEPPELLALELRLALDQIGQLVGEVYTDDLLDRIFSQFCIGK